MQVCNLTYSDARGLWGGQAGYHVSFKPEVSENNSYYQVVGIYNGRRFATRVGWNAVETNYYTDMGFIARIYNYDAAKDSLFRQGFQLLHNENSYTIFPKKGSIVTHVFAVNNDLVWNPDGTFNERNNEFSYTINFRNTAAIQGSLNSQQQNLTYSVKFVTDSVAEPLPPGVYRFNLGGIKFNTDKRKLFSLRPG
jgi:hypothetical protein